MWVATYVASPTTPSPPPLGGASEATVTTAVAAAASSTVGSTHSLPPPPSLSTASMAAALARAATLPAASTPRMGTPALMSAAAAALSTAASTPPPPRSDHVDGHRNGRPGVGRETHHRLQGSGEPPFRRPVGHDSVPAGGTGRVGADAPPSAPYRLDRAAPRSHGSDQPPSGRGCPGRR